MVLIVLASLSVCLKMSAMADTASGEGAKLWGGRFEGSCDPVMAQFNASISYDKAMWKQDIQVRHWQLLCMSGEKVSDFSVACIVSVRDSCKHDVPQFKFSTVY